jgi:hypothetical protein
MVFHQKKGPISPKFRKNDHCLAPTAPYEHSTSSFVAANGFGRFDLFNDPVLQFFDEKTFFLTTTASTAAGAYLAYRKTKSYGWAAAGGLASGAAPLIGIFFYVSLRIIAEMGFYKTVRGASDRDLAPRGREVALDLNLNRLDDALQDRHAKATEHLGAVNDRDAGDSHGYSASEGPTRPSSVKMYSTFE